MKMSNRTVRAIATGGLSLALMGGVGLPLTAAAANSSNSNNSTQPNTRMQHRQEMWSMHQKMLKQAKAEDATLEKLVAELHQAPEAKKPDLEAKILTKLVAEHHQMLNDLETMHARMAQFRHEHMRTQTSMSGGRCMHGGMGQNTTAQK